MEIVLTIFAVVVGWALVLGGLSYKLGGNFHKFGRDDTEE